MNLEHSCDTTGAVVPSTGKVRKKRYFEYVGEKFGMLEIIDFVPEHMGLIVAQCDCGSVNVFPITCIRKGTRKSCGCHTPKTRTPKPLGFKMNRDMYWIWSGMKERCNNPKHKSYSCYGERGICVCQRWEESFENFVADMSPRPKGYTIERKNNGGNYEPGNCVWVSRPHQMRNTRKNVWINYNGEKLCAVDACAKAGIHDSCVRRRRNEFGETSQQAFDYFLRKLAAS